VDDTPTPASTAHGTLTAEGVHYEHLQDRCRLASLELHLSRVNASLTWLTTAIEFFVQGRLGRPLRGCKVYAHLFATGGKFTRQWLELALIGLSARSPFRDPSGSPPDMSEDEEGRARKRLRVSRACDPCRRRKERCDGAQPACQRCTGASRTCFYNPYRKRGLRPGYLRTLEIILGLILHAFEGAESLVLSVLRHRLDDTLTTLHHRGQFEEAPEVSSLLALWRKSPVLEELQSALSSADAVEDEELYIQSLDEKLTSAFNSIPRASSSIDRTRDNPTDDGPFQSQPSTSEPPVPTMSQPQQHPGNLVIPSPGDSIRPAYQLPHNWSHLIDVYVTNTHSWFPIIQKYTLFRTASLTVNAETNQDMRRPDEDELALLWAVFAYSSYQTQAAGLDANPTSVAQDALSGTSSGTFAYAKNLALQEHPQYGLGHVHAQLTLALLEMHRSSWLNAWLWVGRAIYTANIIRIIPPDQDQPHSDEQRRCFLGCFLLDSLVSTKLGFRPYLQRSDLAIAGTMTDEGPEEWESWRPLPGQAATPSTGPGHVLSTFNRLCHMAAMLAKYSDDSTYPRPRLADLLSRLAEREPHGALSQPQSQQSLANEPPHILHAKLAAAAVYCTLQQSEGGANSSLATMPVHDAIRSSLATIVRIARPPADGSSFLSSPWLPPTAQVFAQLLQNQQPPRPTQTVVGGSGGVARFGAQNLIPDKETSFPSTSLRLGDNNRASSAVHLDAAAPSNPIATSTHYGFTISPPINMPAQRPNHRLDLQSEEGLDTPVDPALTRFVPVPTPPLSNRPEAHLPLEVGLRNGGIQTAGTASNGPNSDGLFNQLISLDTSEWCVHLILMFSL
jgi:hypothetical protein